MNENEELTSIKERKCERGKTERQVSLWSLSLPFSFCTISFSLCPVPLSPLFVALNSIHALVVCGDFSLWSLPLEGWVGGCVPFLPFLFCLFSLALPQPHLFPRIQFKAVPACDSATVSPACVSSLLLAGGLAAGLLVSVKKSWDVFVSGVWGGHLGRDLVSSLRLFVSS